MIDFPIDLVITYVDNTDPVWLAAARQFNAELDPKRYRSWDIFNYWFRGVEKNMPFIRTVHLVVSNIEQVPSWLDQSKVHVVLHEDIIPEQLLPTFNSTTIEMFLYRIEGLAEHFIYSNDDMLPMNKMDIEDFFQDGLPVYELINRTHSKNLFRMHCRNSHKLASKLAGKNLDGKRYFYIKHSMDPMLKSVCEEVWEKSGDEIMKRCTKFREPFNYTQYLFPVYGLLSGRGVLGTYSFHYFSMRQDSFACEELRNGTSKIVCINDAGTENFEESSIIIKKVLDKKFPLKSRFEKYDT